MKTRWTRVDAWPVLVALGCVTACSVEGAPGADGAKGRSAAMNVTKESAGANCADGGQRIDYGEDANGNGRLDPNEHEGTTYLCDGATGVGGKQGNTGHDALVDLDVADPGDLCPAGGHRVRAGIDSDGDGKLEDAEVTKTQYVCDGANGVETLVSASDEPAGENCAAGGQKLELGSDTDRNGTLDPGEVTATRFVCNGAKGAVGLSSLVAVSSVEPGAQCSAGGKRIDVGIDVDRSGALDPSEIARTDYVCNGVSGADGVGALVKMTLLDPGATCAAGGQTIDSGLDDGAGGGVAGDSVLEPGEITSTATICFAADGGIRLVDANGLSMGRLVSSGGMMASETTLLTDAGYLYSIDYWDLSIRTDTLYFSNADCTGTAYAMLASAGDVFRNADNFAIRNDATHLYRSVASTFGSHAFLSYGASGQCWSYSGTTNGAEVTATTGTEVGIPALTFTAPIHTE